MNRRRRFVAFAASLLFGGVAILGFAWWYYSTGNMGRPQTEEEQRATLKRLQKFRLAHDPEMAAEYRNTRDQSVVSAHIDPNRRIRLAVGWLGLPDESQNATVGDLIVAGLNAEKNLDLVDRQSLNAVLRETAMSLSGLVRAESAVRAGKILRADWFLLGSTANIHGRAYVLARIVDARTGATRDLIVVSNNRGVPGLAASLADFVRQSRISSTSRHRNLLTIGTFRDLSVNSHQADLGDRVRAHLLAAYSSNTNVIILERECVDSLFQEMRLDQAGMTDKTAVIPSMAMLSAMWTVSGDYLTSEDRGPGVELSLNVVQFFGHESTETIKGVPDEAFLDVVKESVDRLRAELEKSSLDISSSSERNYLLNRGDELTMHMTQKLGSTDYEPAYSWPIKSENIDQAIQAYQTALLLDPGNRLAKISIGVCMEQESKFEEARDYFRQAADPTATNILAGLALADLAWSYRHQDDSESEKWFRKAAEQVNNQFLKARFLSYADRIADEILVKSQSGPARLEWQLRTGIRHATFTGNIPHLFDVFLGAYGTNRAAGVRDLNQVLPKLTREFTNLAPVLIAIAFSRQVETNNPLMSEFEKAVEDCSSNPAQFQAPGFFFQFISGEAVWWCINNRQFAIVPRLFEAKRRAQAFHGRVLSLSDETGERLLNEAQRERANKQPAIKLEDVKLSPADNVVLAHAYVGLEQWKAALDVLDGFPSLPVPSGDMDTPWFKGTIPGISPDLEAICRQRLGRPVTNDPRVFRLGEPDFMFARGGSFATTPEGLWIADGDRLLQLDFNLKTNLSAPLPMNGRFATCLCASQSGIYIGTDQSGLIEYDKSTRQCRSWTESDGLYMNHIMSLCLQGDTLWIGYGSFWTGANGGVGRLDLLTGRFTAFTPALNSPKSAHANMLLDQPPHGTVDSLAADPDGNILVSSEANLQRYRIQEDKWERLPGSPKGQRIVCNATSAFYADPYPSGKTKSSAVQMLTLSNGQWTPLGNEQLLPQNRVSAIALNGQDVWIGGSGFIGVINPVQKTLRKFCYTQDATVHRMEIAGGYVWIAVKTGCIYRIPLSVAE